MMTLLYQYPHTFAYFGEPTIVRHTFFSVASQLPVLVVTNQCFTYHQIHTICISRCFLPFSQIHPVKRSILYIDQYQDYSRITLINIISIHMHYEFKLLGAFFLHFGVLQLFQCYLFDDIMIQTSPSTVNDLPILLHCF